MTDFIQVPDRYTFVRIIDSGGFGTVVEMIEKSSNIHYAGKIVQCLTQKHKERFDREVGRLRTFSHPRIIKLKETVTMEGRQVMVMELGGRSLAEVVQEYTSRTVRMPREEVYRVMEDITSAVDLMHNHSSGRIAHGDVKMENILMDADGHVKLCDFGAAESEDVTATSSAMSQLYVSPERMESETGAATCEADVWALGVVLYWLLFGEPPFTSKNPALLIRTITTFKATSINITCGEEVRALLMRMMDPLCLGKAFRCIVNTADGVWKLRDAEQKELSTRVAILESKQLQPHSPLPSELKMSNVWVGTESLQTLDRTVHKLTPTTLTQIITLETAKWRTAFTFPINEGEWELKIRGNDPLWDVMLGFLKHPHHENPTLKSCGSYSGGIGGDFILVNGGMWQRGEFKPAGTNKKCERVGQTAAIRVNMSTREARLFVDDEEQPGIFPDIPSPLCLGISTHSQNAPIEVLHLARLDLVNPAQGSQPPSESTLVMLLRNEKRKMAEQMERMRMMLRTTWLGTESLKTLDRTAHQINDGTLTQFVKLDKTLPWRTAFTLPIDEGEWELKISGQDEILGFLRHPLPENATQSQCGSYHGGIGGDFLLYNGGMWQGGENKQAGTNKKCNRVGQTATIRVNMSTREARLFVDDSEQPGIFPNIPSPLCLGITTHTQNAPIEVLHLVRTDCLKTELEKQQALSMSTRLKTLEEEKKRAEEKVERMRKMLRTEWIGTDSLQTVDRTVHTLNASTLVQIVELDKS
ncbi:putative Carbon catabolite-derepressing protein kinase [Blattamonas nauphoetae]|uniref:Carbon catabolite-derepressing protein kinase n=1 Tax=Blattamonas nauphoetae TaxID=2049346 RepID=A0ABQ9XCJ0_9EUKA|nr:putative Carbon catabolite-derepressing protein kinase [Blattamonas nauphoetae]